MKTAEGKGCLFQGNYLVIPGTVDDKDALAGVEKEKVHEAFGELAWYPVPAIEGPEVFQSFLLDKDHPLPAGWRTVSVRQAVSQSAFPGALPGLWPGRESGVLRAYHVIQWREDSRFCGNCGAANADSPDELARLCPRCGRLEFPRLSPAVIVLVTNERGEALLAHNRKFKENLYSLIAGFCEAGESLEAAVVREVKEEVNVDIKDLRYKASQSWPFPNSLMVGWTASYAGGTLKCDGKEITTAQWFSADSVKKGVPELPAPGSVSRSLIDRWLDGM